MIENEALRAIAMVTLVVGVAVLVVRNNRAYRREQPRTDFVVVRPPAECIEGATAYMARMGYAVAHVGGKTATFVRPKKPDTGVGVVLLLLGLIPGLLYFGLFGGTYTTTLVAVPEGRGARLLLSGDDPDGRKDLYGWARMAFEPPEET